jgi:excisionase family DNA binding protein
MTDKREKSQNGARSATPRFYTISDIAEFLDVSPRSVRRWIKNGKLVAHRFGATVRIGEADFAAFVALHRGI